MSAMVREAPVGIVGAGPVGLVAAARLASFGLRSVVFEAGTALRDEGSKACLIQGDVLEVLDKFGCGDPVASEGVPWSVGHTFVRDREVRTEIYADRPGFPPFVNISQRRIEEIVLEAVEASGLSEVCWGHRVVGIEQDPAGVTVETDVGGRRRRHRVSHLIACDGIRSVCRELLSVGWTGYRHGDRFLITDIKADLPFPRERQFHFDPSCNRGRQLVIHAQPDDVWRIDWQLAPDADIEEEMRTGAFNERVRSVIGDSPFELKWWSTYRFNQRVVDQFVAGRSFLAGDAAHALPPYGARGMNSGIQDVDNLAWKLAAVVHRRAEPALLETYHHERFAAALENLAVTEATIRFMAPPTLLARLGRQVVLALAARSPRVRRHVNSGHMAEPFVYQQSSVIDTSGDHPFIGQFCPDAPIEVDGRSSRLRKLLGRRFSLVIVSDDTIAADRFAAAAARTPLPGHADIVATTPEEPPSDQHVTWARYAPSDAPNFTERFATPSPTWLLVRPDGHVAAAERLRPQDAGAAATRAWQALHRCAGLRATAGSTTPALVGVSGADRLRADTEEEK